MGISNVLIFIIIVIVSAIFHEIAHGLMAERFGDDTARMMGRITLNPISHIDPYFTILVPALLALSHAPIIGGAKPVPVNYYKLRNFRWGVFWVSIAGVLTNLLLALVFGLSAHFSNPSSVIYVLFVDIAQVNVLLALFNLIPIPPLDGSKVLASLLGVWAINKIMSIEMRGLWGILPFVIIIYFLFATSLFQTILVPIGNVFFRFVGIPGF